MHDDVLTLYNDHKLVIRPYVVICGQSLSEIKTAFVIAEPLRYQVSSVSEAISVCFQLMKIFQEPYSKICNHLWEFIEKRIYGFDLKDPHAGVIGLIELLNRK